MLIGQVEKGSVETRAYRALVQCYPVAGHSYEEKRGSWRWQDIDWDRVKAVSPMELLLIPNVGWGTLSFIAKALGREYGTMSQLASMSDAALMDLLESKSSMGVPLAATSEWSELKRRILK